MVLTVLRQEFERYLKYMPARVLEGTRAWSRCRKYHFNSVRTEVSEFHVAEGLRDVLDRALVRYMGFLRFLRSLLQNDPVAHHSELHFRSGPEAETVTDLHALHSG